jgi:hypothetical protein
VKFLSLSELDELELNMDFDQVDYYLIVLWDGVVLEKEMVEMIDITNHVNVTFFCDTEEVILSEEFSIVAHIYPLTSHCLYHASDVFVS